MRTLKFTLEYEGSSFHGWQRQSLTADTIQEVFEKALRSVLDEAVKVVGAGRTDAGVSALAQVAHCRTSSSIPLKKLTQALNGLLPRTIAVTAIEEVPPRFHAQRSAKSKLYRYVILNSRYRSALLNRCVHWYPFRLDLAAMKRASRILVGRHDFKAMCGSGSSVRSTVRTIRRITVRRVEGSALHQSDRARRLPLIIIDVEGKGFLYTMVRTIVGTLIEVGRGRLSPGSLKEIISSRDRRAAGPTAPAKGLCLLKVMY